MLYQPVVADASLCYHVLGPECEGEGAYKLNKGVKMTSTLLEDEEQHYIYNMHPIRASSVIRRPTYICQCSCKAHLQTLPLLLM